MTTRETRNWQKNRCTPTTQLAWAQAWACVPHWPHFNDPTDVGTDVSLCAALNVSQRPNPNDRSAVVTDVSLCNSLTRRTSLLLRSSNLNNNRTKENTRWWTNTQRWHTYGGTYTRKEHVHGVTSKWRDIWIEARCIWMNNQTNKNTYGRGTIRRGHTHGGYIYTEEIYTWREHI